MCPIRWAEKDADQSGANFHDNHSCFMKHKIDGSGARDMESIERIKSTYRSLKARCAYFKSYLEHMEAISRKASDLLFRAAQIPRDVAWSDPHIIHCIETGDRQRMLFDSVSTRYSQELVKELEQLNSRVTEELRILDEEVKTIFDKTSVSLEELKSAREHHFDAWVRGRCDPWLTESRLRRAIRRVFCSDDEANNVVKYKIADFQSALGEATEAFSRIVSGFIKTQRELFVSLSEVSSAEVVACEEIDRYYDAEDEENAGDSSCRMTERVQATLDSLIEGMSRDAEKSGVVIKRSLEVCASSICIFKRGYTGDWRISLALVTSTRYVHFVDLNSIIEEYKDYEKLVWKIKWHRDRGIVSLFESKKCRISPKDEELLRELNAIIRHKLESLVDNIAFSCRIDEKVFTLEKDRCTMMIDGSGQLGLGSFLGIGIIKVRFMAQKDAEGLFASLSGTGTKSETTACEHESGTKTNGDGEAVLRIVLDEENPWM
jgi:hypothetical protein